MIPYLTCCRHLYYVDDAVIYRCHLDGTHSEMVASPFAFELRGLSIDIAHNMLYWTRRFDGSMWSLSIDEFEQLAPGTVSIRLAVLRGGWSGVPLRNSSIDEFEQLQTSLAVGARGLLIRTRGWVLFSTGISFEG